MYGIVHGAKYMQDKQDYNFWLDKYINSDSCHIIHWSNTLGASIVLLTDINILVVSLRYR